MMFHRKTSYSTIFAAAAVAVVIGNNVAAFVPSISTSGTAKKAFITKLNFISERDIEGPPPGYEYDDDTVTADYNPKQDIQQYINRSPRQPVNLRDTAKDKIVMVSGLMKEEKKIATTTDNDQFIFDLLNNAGKEDDDDNKFQYDKIIAYVDDVSYAKKRLISRSSRYSGLLNKLDYVQSSVSATTSEEEEESAPYYAKSASEEEHSLSSSLLPTLEQIDNNGVSSWLAYVGSGTFDETVHHVNSIISLSKKSKTMKNVAMLITNAHTLSIDEQNLLKDIIYNEALNDSNQDDDVKFSMLIVGEMDDRADGKVPYSFKELSSISTEDELFTSTAATVEQDDVSDSTTAITSTCITKSFSRNEAFRMVTECLQLQSSVNKAFVCTEVLNDMTKNETSTEFKLIKALRTAGYTRTQEIDYMLNGGVKNYNDAVDEFYGRHPELAKAEEEEKYTGPNWWEAPQYAEASKEMEDHPVSKYLKTKVTVNKVDADGGVSGLGRGFVVKEEEIDYASKFE